MSTKGHITCQIACAKGLVTCYMPPNFWNMPKTRMAWTQNMSKQSQGEKNEA
jgi:hypothetical protein